MPEPSVQAEILSQALPYMQRYEGASIVVKFGGNAMVNRELSEAFARDVALMHQSGAVPVVVHGGGPQIGAMLEKMGIVSEFKDGLRVTDRATVEIVEMVLAGSINKSIVAAFNAQGARAVGLCGKDGDMVRARKLRRSTHDPDSNIERIVDLGFVGEPTRVDVDVLDMIANSGLIPVIAPLALGEDGETYNINADTFAGVIAVGSGAERLLFLTDVPGVKDADGELIRELTVAEARHLIKREVITGGMIPKVETCIQAIEDGVPGVVILDGTVPHAVLLELYTDHGAGTLILP